MKSAGSYDAANKDERDTIVCDENGFGQTKDMPYGIYTVHQTSGWEGREMMDDFDVFISQNAQTYRYLINNRNFESFVNVVKVDAESGKSIPYAGAGFKIYDPQGNQVKMTFTYPTPTTIDVFYTDANGSLVTPEKLDYGKGYSIVEVQAPYGYVLDDTPVYFDITEENSTEEGGVTVVKVNKPNMAQKGTITVEKTGEVFSGVNVSGSEDSDVIYQPVYEVAGLEGAVYEVRAAEDISTPDGTLRYSKGEVVDTITTSSDGFVKSKELYLGKYEVKEITAPYGMVVSGETHTVELTYAGQNISVTETSTSFYNERQKVQVSLAKAIEKDETFGIGDNGEIKNISFGLYAAEDIVSASGTVIPADGLIEIVSVNENGTAVMKSDLPFGKYYVKEIATDEHYILSDTKYPVVFEYAGQDTATVEIKVNDDGFYSLIIGATDMGTGCDTILAQMAAECLECKPEEVVVFGVDTDISPYDCGSYASSTTYVTGQAVVKTCESLRKKICERGAEYLGCKPEDVDFDGEYVTELATGKQISRSQIGNNVMCFSNAPLSASEAFSSPVSPPPFMVGMAEVEIDKETGVLELIDYVAVVDCGTVINPNLARVQVEGGIAQGIGMALYEDIVYSEKGKNFSNSLMQYKIPTRLDVGTIRVEFESSYEPTGPFGAKSIGEIVINTPSPAISNAIQNATGVIIRELPMTAEKIYRGISGR